jgi:formylglycine-generating enzyme required for sulfatase activity
LADILNVQKDFFDSKNGNVKEDLRFQSPSDLFLRTTEYLIGAELDKETTKTMLRKNSLQDCDRADLIAELERAMGAIALEMATRGYWTLVAGAKDEVIRERNKIRRASKKRFKWSRDEDSVETSEFADFWKFAWEFVRRFLSSGGGLQLEAGSSFLQFPTRKIQEMRIARYLSRYAAAKDCEAIYLGDSDVEYAEAVKPEQSFDRRRGASQHHSSVAWEEVWRNVIGMPLAKGERPGLEAKRYERVLRWLFQPSHTGERRPTQLMTEAWVQAQKLGKQDTKWQHFADNLVSGLQQQFQQILAGAHGEDKKTIAQSLMDPGTYQILGKESGSGLDGDTGRFRMGAKEKDKKEVTLSRFGIQKLLISNAQFQLFDDSYVGSKEERNRFGNDDQPAIFVNWYDAWWFSRFVCEVVVNNQPYRVTLPTEAQWEYSARAGSKGEFFRAALSTKKIIEVTEDLLPEYANFDQDWRTGTLPVSSKLPNLWGLRMAGNAWQWTLDGWQDTLLGGPDPLVTGSMGSYRVRRGGGWGLGAALCRSADRSGITPVSRKLYYGFRLALSPSGIPRSGELQTGIKID